MVNQIILVGNLGRDPEVREAGGRTVAILRLATSRSLLDKRSGQRKEEREWHDIEVWGRNGELCGQYLAKGRQIYVAGRLKTDRWKDKQTGHDRQRVKIVAELVQFLGGSVHETSHRDRNSAADDRADDAPPPADDTPSPTPPPDLDDLERIP